MDRRRAPALRVPLLLPLTRERTRMDLHLTTRSTVVSGVALAALLGLAACGDGGSTVASDGGGGSPAASAAAAHNDQDISFVKDMEPHHEQAVEMAEAVLAKDPGPAVRALAERIKASQEPEIEQLQAMLEAFDVEDDSAAGHGSGHGGASQTAGATGDEDLEEASGTEAERLFLEGMLEHHDGAVEMATEEIDAGAYPQAISLAEQIKAEQQAEIAEMRTLLGKA